MEILLKYYLPIFMLLNLGITFIVPSVRVYKKTGINPITFGKTDNAHDYIGFIMKILTGLLVVAVLLYSFSRKLYQFLSPIAYLNIQWVAIVGLALMHLSLLWIVIAQYQMRLSWRIGIDEKNKTNLVTGGVFGTSRNPIFLGMILSVIGLFLVIPNAITFFIAFCTYIVIQIQIRLEEDFLIKQHGALYESYKGKVPRLL